VLAPLDSLAPIDTWVGATVRFAGSVSRFAQQALCGGLRTPLAPLDLLGNAYKASLQALCGSEGKTLPKQVGRVVTNDQDKDTSYRDGIASDSRDR
jgi:hypothetical protein